MGPKVGKPADTPIDPETDYFAYHQEFWIYLYREEGVAFNDMTSEDSHLAFQRFADRYNAGELEAPYYNKNTTSGDNSTTANVGGGFPPEAIEQAKTTRHSWTFRTSETERRGLEQLQQGVRKQTEYFDEKKN